MKTQMGTAQTDTVADSTTIEVMLSPQQMEALAHGSNVDATHHWRSRILIGTAVAAVLVVLGSVAHLAAKQKPTTAAVAQARAPAPAPLPPLPEAPPPAATPVLFRNPFDRTEMFEFPPGTTQAQARDTVARLLMDRAHGRGPDVLKLKIRKIRSSKRLTTATETRSDRPALQVSSSQPTSESADQR